MHLARIWLLLGIEGLRTKLRGDARAVWILAPSIVNSEFKALSTHLINYVRSGGTVVLGGLFSIGVSQSDFNRWMQEWGLSWTYGEYKKRNMAVFESASNGSSNFRGNGLAAAYPYEGVTLENVPIRNSWYAVRGYTTTEALLCGTVVQTSVALTKVGLGWLGWTGDFHNRDETTAVVRAMMGLNKKNQGDHVPSSKLLRRLFKA
ncbi:hypothetical protein F4820DRAFT_453300 [Hypoxylon rubiginosum]|uniref:Uncharacterized protein n=1 Tax=Hypoxylon rubiginosum TaxID=110542 RepID=A0ACB9YKV8_9PEZI|nr:hypothetical protein F4820DRAFT_453300 [Hypoxylon rubiginosum]